MRASSASSPRAIRTSAPLSRRTSTARGSSRARTSSRSGRRSSSPTSGPDSPCSSTPSGGMSRLRSRARSRTSASCRWAMSWSPPSRARASTRTCCRWPVASRRRRRASPGGRGRSTPHPARRSRTRTRPPAAREARALARPFDASARILLLGLVGFYRCPRPRDDGHSGGPRSPAGRGSLHRVEGDDHRWAECARRCHPGLVQALLGHGDAADRGLHRRADRGARQLPARPPPDGIGGASGGCRGETMSSWSAWARSGCGCASSSASWRAGRGGRAR